MQIIHFSQYLVYLGNVQLSPVIMFHVEFLSNLNVIYDKADLCDLGLGIDLDG